MIRALLTIIAALLVLLAVLWVFQRSLIYLPLSGSVPPVGRVLDSATEVTLQTHDGLELGAWYVLPEESEPVAVVLVANGNAGNRSMRAPLARALVDRGFAALLFDYRGFGGNSGRPTEQGLAQDVRAAYRFLATEGHAPDRMIYFGESLGAAVVTELASEYPPAGLVLRSPFVDLASVGRIHYPFLPVGLLLRDRYPLAEHLASLQVPTTVVYGSSDSIVEPDQSRAVARSGVDVVAVELTGADHNDRVFIDGAELLEAIQETARRAGLISASES